jgi:hypothetical protein|tara:strand:+ start:293 stop:466 length:174 start_codon:yes stop_codon:yes gene_type:complete
MIMIEIFFNNASTTLILLIWACFALPVLLIICVTILGDKIDGINVLGKNWDEWKIIE